MTSEPWILGYSASHNGAVCLLRGSRIVVAVQEERLTRQKRALLSSLDESCALRYCLDYAGITLSDVTAIGLVANIRRAAAVVFARRLEAELRYQVARKVISQGGIRGRNPRCRPSSPCTRRRFRA